jgi:hypothetical protein
MKRTFALVFLAAVVLSSTAAAQKAAPAPTTKELLRWKGKGAKLFVRNLNGPLEVVGVAAGAELEIVGVASGRGELAQVKAEVHPGNGSVTVCALYPGKKGSCGPDGAYDLSGGGDALDEVQVSFQVKLPRGVKLDVELVNGHVVARGLAADAEIETVNGRVEVAQERGALDLSSVNGAIRITTGASGACDVETVNGSVDIQLTGGAEVAAETVNGRIQIAGERFEREARKTLGKGGRRVDVETVNGAITVR